MCTVICVRASIRVRDYDKVPILTSDENMCKKRSPASRWSAGVICISTVLHQQLLSSVVEVIAVLKICHILQHTSFPVLDLFP